MYTLGPMEPATPLTAAQIAHCTEVVVYSAQRNRFTHVVAGRKPKETLAAKWAREAREAMVSHNTCTAARLQRFDSLTLKTGGDLWDEERHVAWLTDSEGDLVGVGDGECVEDATEAAYSDAFGTILREPAE